MKYLLLLLASVTVNNFTAQNLITNSSSNQGIKKIKSVINKEDINRLNLESKIVGKTALPALYRFKNKQLILNGAGLRELLWVDVYACGLYMREPEVNPLNVIDKKEIMIIRMDILSKAVSHKKLIKAFQKGFEDNNNKQTITQLRKELTDFMGFMSNVSPKIGDKFDIVYEPNIGVSLYINYKKIGTTGDLNFKKAIFKIWLANNPVDKSLKPELLSGAKEFLVY